MNQEYDYDNRNNREWCEEHCENYNELNGKRNIDPPPRLDSLPEEKDNEHSR